MRKILLPLLFIFFTGIVNIHAQKKLFSYDQLFKGATTNIAKPLPTITGWADNEHYFEIRKEGDKSVTYSVDAKTGKVSVYEKKDESPVKATSAFTSVKSARNTTLSPDKKWAAYTKPDNNLYVTNLDTKSETQLTNDGSETILNGYASWVYYEEILGRGSRYKAFWWSPNSQHLCYMRFDDAEVPLFPIFWSDGQHGKLENERYPKAGDKNPEVTIGVISIANLSKTIWADFNSKEDQYFGTPLWTPSNQLWIQWMNRGQDTFKIYSSDLSTGIKTIIYEENQKTWIDLDEQSRIEFLPDGKTFIVKSDKDGWENLYLHDENGKLINPITIGNFWGTNILRIDEKTKTVYFRARKENSARFDFYKVGLNGKSLTRLSFGEYSHDQINLSPNGNYFITTYSNVSSPPAMAIVDTKGKIIRELGNNKGTEFNNYAMPKVELSRIKSTDGLFDLPIVITYPVNFDPAKKYPVLVSIYGGPNAGTVYDRWRQAGGATQWWAQEGIIQVAFDNRSSGHFGKKGLNYIHRQLGKYEIEDYMACGKWLRNQPWVDSNRLGITGGSFGGYMTCMALTYGAAIFNYGIANASVTDWHLYDSHYTERFMDTPNENPEGYQITSVMNYAEKYKGLLRIVHGTSDDNVHMQNSIQLVNKLEELKKHFEFMLYPGERHGIGGNSSNKAQHNRIETFAFYYQYLLNKPMPAVFLDGNTPQRGF
ncbi:MAG: DPP IV N-terminal domain-containing protein [Chitinophagaceae bacterium]